LLQRAKIFICFIIPKVTVYAGEKSRFITQLEVEKQRNQSYQIYNAVCPETAYTPMVLSQMR
jgi:hypothetical protein